MRRRGLNRAECTFLAFPSAPTYTCTICQGVLALLWYVAATFRASFTIYRLRIRPLFTKHLRLPCNFTILWGTFSASDGGIQCLLFTQSLPFDMVSIAI